MGSVPGKPNALSREHTGGACHSASPSRCPCTATSAAGAPAGTAALDKEPALQALKQALVDRFGAAAFPVEDWRPDTPGAVCFTHADDRRLYISVVTLGQRRDRYSVMVEVYRQGDPDFPFDVVTDRQELQLPELLDMCAELLNAESGDTSGGSGRRGPGS